MGPSRSANQRCNCSEVGHADISVFLVWLRPDSLVTLVVDSEAARCSWYYSVPQSADKVDDEDEQHRGRAWAGHCPPCYCPARCMVHGWRQLTECRVVFGPRVNPAPRPSWSAWCGAISSWGGARAAGRFTLGSVPGRSSTRISASIARKVPCP